MFFAVVDRGDRAARAASPPTCASRPSTAASRSATSGSAPRCSARRRRPRRSTCSPATPSTTSATAGWSGSATPPTRARAAPPSASASPSRASSASTWSSRAATATPPGTRCSTASGPPCARVRALAGPGELRLRAGQSGPTSRMVGRNLPLRMESAGAKTGGDGPWDGSGTSAQTISCRPSSRCRSHPCRPRAGLPARRFASNSRRLRRSTFADLELVVSELVTNAVEHGRGTVQVEVSHSLREVRAPSPTGARDSTTSCGLRRHPGKRARAGDRQRPRHPWGIRRGSTQVWFAISLL